MPVVLIEIKGGTRQPKTLRLGDPLAGRAARLADSGGFESVSTRAR